MASAASVKPGSGFLAGNGLRRASARPLRAHRVVSESAMAHVWVVNGVCVLGRGVGSMLSGLAHGGRCDVINVSPHPCPQAARAEAKDIAFDADSRAKMQRGINKLARAVGVTLGPRGGWLPLHVHNPLSLSLPPSLLASSEGGASHVIVRCLHLGMPLHPPSPPSNHGSHLSAVAAAVSPVSPNLHSWTVPLMLTPTLPPPAPFLSSLVCDLAPCAWQAATWCCSRTSACRR